MAGALESPLQKLSTPATEHTGEIAIRLKVSSAKMPDRIPTGGTAYRNIQNIPKVQQAEFGDYILTKIEGFGDYWNLTFGAPKTAAQMAQRYHYEIKTENYPWSPVVLTYRNEPDYRSALEMRDSGGNAFYQNKWNTKYNVLEGIQGATQILYEWFIAPSEFTILSKPIIQQPQHVPAGHLPGDVSEPIGSALIAKRIRVALSVIGPVVQQWRTMEPTIPAGRVRHVIDDDQNQTDTGHYIRLRKTAIPPIGGRIRRDR